MVDPHPAPHLRVWLIWGPAFTYLQLVAARRTLHRTPEQLAELRRVRFRELVR